MKPEVKIMRLLYLGRHDERVRVKGLKERRGPTFLGANY